MEVFYQKLLYLHGKFKTVERIIYLNEIFERLLRFRHTVKSIGFLEIMDDYEKRKLGIFNQLNFLQLIAGILIPVSGSLYTTQVPFSEWIVTLLPACISTLVLALNYHRKHNLALQAYFILYPFFTCIIYIHGINLGVELSFILYGILSVFFIHDVGFMLFSIAFSMISYFMLSVVLKNFQYQVQNIFPALYLFNQGIAIVFIYYGLFLIKKENTGYQWRILAKNRTLHKKNLEINAQQKELAEKASLLSKQKEELAELNALKNKLFSVISHDLKAPMYALRNLFRNIQQLDLPASEIKAAIPNVVNDLNYTTSLMENLLQWAKSQMETGSIKKENINVSRLIDEVIQLLRLQAETKQIYIDNKNSLPVFISADKDMINLVLRNLISNAIKFTPPQGKVSVGTNELSSFVEIYVEDNGTGMSKEALQKISQQQYFTTKGTASESGTGLGLMLCKEFLVKNGGQMFIESDIGKGSVFSFTLPKAV